MLFVSKHCGKVVISDILGGFGWELDVVVNVVCLSPVTWKKNNNVESPTSPEQRRPSKRVRISVVVRATDLGHTANGQEAARQQVHQPISRLPPCHSILGLIPECRWTVMGCQAQPISICVIVPNCVERPRQCRVCSSTS